MNFVRAASIILVLVAFAPSSFGQAAVDAQGDPIAPGRTSQDLVGAWSADFDKMLAAQAMSEEERQMARAFLGGAEMILQFNADGTLTMEGMLMGEEQSEFGTWGLNSADDQTLYITVSSQEPGGVPEVEEMVVVFQDDDVISISDDQGEAIPFNRTGGGPTPALVEAGWEAPGPEWSESDGTEASFELLEGTWRAEFEVMLAQEEMSEEEYAMASTFLADASMLLSFNGDGTLLMTGQMMGQEQNEEGTWEGVELDGISMSINTATEGEEGPENEVMTVEFLSVDRIRIADDEGQQIPFSRVPAE